MMTRSGPQAPKCRPLLPTAAICASAHHACEQSTHEPDVVWSPHVGSVSLMPAPRRVG